MNRWSRRFTSLEQIDVIRARARLQPRRLTHLDTLRPGVAAAKLREALLATYFPTHQAGKVMQSIIEAGRGHCVANYSTEPAFERVAHGSEVPPVDIEPILVTGLAGVGKTKLLEALARVLPEDSNFKTGDRAICFPLQTHWRLKLESSQSLSTTLTKIAEQAQPGTDVPRGNDAKAEQLRRLAYRNGLALLMLDEVQFRTHSNATAAIADLFHRLRTVAPFVLAANFSLVRNLLKSNQQDRDRILAESIEMLPDHPESDDWHQLVYAYVEVAPEVYPSSLADHAPDIWRLTAGLPRYLRRLMHRAYKLARADQRHVVEMRDLDAAYLSPANFASRDDVEAIHNQIILGRPLPGRRDLWSPLGSEEDYSTCQEYLAKKRAASVASHYQGEALTQDEAHASVERDAKEAGQTPASQCHRDAQRPKKGPSKANRRSTKNQMSLEESNRQFLDSLQ